MCVCMRLCLCVRACVHASVFVCVHGCIVANIKDTYQLYIHNSLTPLIQLDS